MKNIRNHEHKAPFPGLPGMYTPIISQNLFEAGEKLDSMGTDVTVQAGEILQALAICMLEPSTYDELQNGVGVYYGEMKKFWDDIYVQNGGVLGSGKLDLREVDSVKGLDVSIPNELGQDAMNTIQGLLLMTSDKDFIKDHKQEFGVLSRVIWAIFIGLFDTKFFGMNYSNFVTCGAKAQKKLQSKMAKLN